MQKYQRITAVKLGDEYKINERTVRKYANYAKSIDSLAEKEPEIISEILTGKIKISYNNISKLTNQPSSQASLPKVLLALLNLNKAIIVQFV